MTRRPYNSNLTPTARELRTNATRQENHLWYDYLRYYSPRFTRQRIVGNFILDFYCAKAKLAIELDGSQHYEEGKMKYDEARTEFLENLGVKVMRFTNLDVDEHFEGVCRVIDERVKVLLNNVQPPALRATPLQRRGQGSAYRK